MIDSKYIEKLEDVDIRWYNYLIKYKGGEHNALKSLLKDLDCTKIYNNGQRPMQTINYGYRADIAGFIYIYNKLIEKEPNCDINYIDKLVNRHEQNINFEKTNPPIYYTSKQTRSRTNNRRTAEITDIFSGEKSQVDVGTGKIIKPKNNSATRKAKALSNKSISFAFGNFKINK